MHSRGRSRYRVELEHKKSRAQETVERETIKRGTRSGGAKKIFFSFGRPPKSN